jgi:hypothetical protein
MARKDKPKAKGLEYARTFAYKAGLEGIISSMRGVPPSKRPVIEIAILSTSACVAIGRDPWLCFGFGLVVIIIHVAWSVWKRSRFDDD